MSIVNADFVNAGRHTYSKLHTYVERVLFANCYTSRYRLLPMYCNWTWHKCLE